MVYRCSRFVTATAVASALFATIQSANATTQATNWTFDFVLQNGTSDSFEGKGTLTTIDTGTPGNFLVQSMTGTLTESGNTATNLAISLLAPTIEAVHLNQFNDNILLSLGGTPIAGNVDGTGLGFTTAAGGAFAALNWVIFDPTGDFWCNANAGPGFDGCDVPGSTFPAVNKFDVVQQSTNNSGSGNGQPTSIAEPSMLLLAGTGLAGLALFIRRRRSAGTLPVIS